MTYPDEALSHFAELDILRCVQLETEAASVRYQAADVPRAILLAGQPGAGKTVLSDMFVSEFKDNVAFVNGDDYRRQHPHYRELYGKYGSDFVDLVSPFSNQVSNKLIDIYSDQHFHLIVEGTGRTVQVPLSTSEMLSRKGYSVEMSVIAAKPLVSLISTLLRFYNMNKVGTVPRATAIAAHDNFVDVLPHNLDILRNVPTISRMTIWTRERDLLYDSECNHSMPSRALIDYWDLEWTEEEIESVRRSIDSIREFEESFHLGQSAVIQEIERRMEQQLSPSGLSYDLTL